MSKVKLICHTKGAPGLRFFGLGPGLRPQNGLKKLQNLLNNNTFWATNRSREQIRRSLANSTEIVSLWVVDDLIGFGRATSDHVFRAVFWDLVIREDLQGNGYGKIVVEALLNRSSIKKVEKIYLMSTNSSSFYEQLNFKEAKRQKLLLKNN
tara:strand:+ start:454 stop:909 length:456 start_codon:yes stop_codon:yes gene_type:complete